MHSAEWARAIAANQRLWDELTAIHLTTGYRVAEFKAGTKKLDTLVTEEVSPVTGKTLLHLQCHFGLDTLGWARLGATVTGVDLAPQAIAAARALAQEVDLPATFIQSDLYTLPDVLAPDATFDIVFSSWGVLCWLPDLTCWAQIIAAYLKPGGMCYLADAHPFLNMFYNEADAPGLAVTYPYFHDSAPHYFAPGPDYASSQQTTVPSYEWRHSLGDIQNALIAAGLQIEFLHEHSFCAWQYFPFMECGADRWWRLPATYPAIPLSFSVRARKGA
jgi:SAM-dependent methyltransferase